MIVKYAAKMSCRALLKTLLFLLLLTLISAMLASSLGLTVSVESALRDCRENYRTIGVAEYYTGTETVNAAELHPVAEQMSQMSLPTGAVQWTPARQAQGCFTDIDKILSVNPVKNKAVLLVKCCEQSTGQATVYITDRDGNMKKVPASVEQPEQVLVVRSFFSEKPVETHFMDVKTVGQPFEVGHYYLICGEFFQGNLLNHCLELTEDVPEFAPLDVTDGEDYLLPEQSPFYDLADEYRLRERSFCVYAAPQLEDFLPFQQKAAKITEGRMFTPDEESSGAAVCIVSGAIAETLGLSVGDRTTLSLAVREDAPLLESYRIRDGFDLQKEYAVVGICDAQDNWNDAVFIPIPDGIDMTVNHCSSVLGQYRVDNKNADLFRRSAAALLPDGVQISVYDQGYSRAVRPLENTLRTVRIITAVCLLVGLGFLLLLGWLLIYRQRQVGSLMLRNGATRKDAAVHYLTSAALIALPAAALGSIVSIALSGVVARFVNQAMLGASDAELLFSNSGLSLQQAGDLNSVGASVPLLIGICFGVFVLALLSCLFFFEKSLPRHPLRQQQHGSRRHAKSRSLRGGAFKYAVLSVVRGGFRSVLPLLAALCAVILFSQLTSSVSNCSAELDALGKNSKVRGYFTDYSGQKCGDVMIDMKNVYRLAESGLVASMSVSDSENYMFYAAIKDGTLTDAETPIVPHSEYSVPAAERRMANSPSLIFTNSIADLPKFLHSHAPEITWLDGYDETVLDGAFIPEYHLATVYKDGLVPAEDPNGIEEQALIQHMEGIAEDLNALPCIAPTSLMQAHGLALGDDFLVIPLIGQDAVAFHRLQIVGCYDKANGRDDLILPLSAVLGGDTLEMHGEVYNDVMGLSKYSYMHFSIRSAVFRVSCEDLAGTKTALSEAGYSSPYAMDGQRIFLVMEDSDFYLSRHAIEQRLWYMERIFPAVYGITLALAVVLSVLQVQARKKELRLMRSLGTGIASAFGSIFTEQLILCPLGLLLGLLVCKLLGSLSRLSLLLSVLFAGLWLLGAFITSLRSCGGKLLTTRREDG